MLALLPRSATGQKLTVYTSLIHGSRRPGEADGPQERHLVIVDNGRLAMRQSPLAEALYCIRCGACLNACPVFREIGGHTYGGVHGESSAYPGPIGSVVAPGLFGQETFGQLARASSLCGACMEVCPVGIDLPKLLLRVRAGEVGRAYEEGAERVEKRAKPNAPGWMRLALSGFSWIARSPVRFRLAQRAAGLFSRLYARRAEWMHMPAFTGWGYSKDFPRPALNTFREKWASGQVSSGKVDSGQWGSGQVESQHDSEEYIGNQSGSKQWAVRWVERFEEELKAVGGKLVRCRAEDVAGRVVEVLQERGINAVQAWEDSYLPEGLLEELRIANIEVVHAPEPSVRAGLTGASAAIAETGSLLLCGDAERPLTASLLTEVHMAVIHEEDILDNLMQVMNLREVREAPAAVIITGPSRTADIEMALTIGVHGPGEVIVFCVAIS